MGSRNVETYRAGHEAFNRRDFEAMTAQYAERIAWTVDGHGIPYLGCQVIPRWPVVLVLSDCRRCG
jgi:hypothetical protein